jgi:predicted RND superfamily exporter protein
MKSVLSFEMQWWNLPEDMQNYWQIYVLSYLCIVILFVLLLLQRRRHRQKETEQNLTEVQMILQNESFIHQLRATMSLMQEVQDEHSNQLQNEIESLKELTKTKERHIDELQNMTDSVKTMKMGYEYLAELQNQMGLKQKAMEAKNKRFAQF